MKRTLMMLALAAAVLSTAWASLPAGKGEDYHHALQLCFTHAADNALALYNLASLPSFNKDLAVQHIADLGKELEDARVFHAMVHKTYTEASAKEIGAEHTAILVAHTTAVQLLADLKTAAAKGNKAQVKELSGEIYKNAAKAAKADKEAMAKLQIAPLTVPN